MAITTIYTYPLDGTQREFSVPFEYLARRFVVLTLIGTDRKELTLTTDYRFTSRSLVQTNVAWGPGAGYERIEIRRNTSATDRLVDFADGSILRASELNISQIQTLHVAEEARNMVADTISENSDGALDARGRKVANVADPFDPGDVVTLRFEQAWAESTLNNKNTAVAAANTATSQASTALVYKNAAESAKTASETARTQSSTYATNSQTSATASDSARAAAVIAKNAAEAAQAAALVSQNAAKTSETNSKISETNAATSAANLGNAVSLYSKVESVVGDAISWNPSVSHKIGRLTFAGSTITDLDSVLFVDSQFLCVRHATQPYLLFRDATNKNVGAISASVATGVLALSTYTAAGAGSYTFAFDRTGKFLANEVGAQTVTAGTNMTSKSRPVVICSQSAWTNIAFTALGATISHNLGVIPFGYSIMYKCTVAEFGYAVGDIIHGSNVDFSSSSTSFRGVTPHSSTTTTVTCHQGGIGIVIPHKSTGAAQSMTAANWDFQLTAMGMG